MLRSSGPQHPQDQLLARLHQLLAHPAGPNLVRPGLLQPAVGSQAGQRKARQPTHQRAAPNSACRWPQVCSHYRIPEPKHRLLPHKLCAPSLQRWSC